MSDQDQESIETRDEISTRDDLLTEIHNLNAIVKRLQNDNLELASIREYLKSLRDLHKRCGLLVEMVIADKGVGVDLRKYAEEVKKYVSVLAQR